MRVLLTALVAVFLFACTSSQQVQPFNCSDYGVHNIGQQLTIHSFNELWQEQIESICGPNRAGCVKEREDGTADVYWRVGDTCAMWHEFGHVVCGLAHTVKYDQVVIAGGNTRQFCR